MFESEAPDHGGATGTQISKCMVLSLLVSLSGGRERQRHCPWNELTSKAAVFLHRRDFKEVNQKTLKSEEIKEEIRNELVTL